MLGRTYGTPLTILHIEYVWFLKKLTSSLFFHFILISEELELVSQETCKCPVREK